MERCVVFIANERSTEKLCMSALCLQKLSVGTGGTSEKRVREASEASEGVEKHMSWKPETPSNPSPTRPRDQRRYSLSKHSVQLWLLPRPSLPGDKILLSSLMLG